jgi:hypothetical protein
LRIADFGLRIDAIVDCGLLIDPSPRINPQSVNLQSALDNRVNPQS